MKNHVVKLLLLSCFGILLLLVRAWYAQSIQYVFLIWNILLAWVPLCLTWYLSKKATPNMVFLIISIGFWLLFLPNAPYLITDLKHIKKSNLDYVWVDPLIFFSFSFVGVYTALLSTSLVHKTLSVMFNAWVAWFVVVLCFILSGFGVYLGRIKRFNSWDIFTHPFQVIKDSCIAAQNTQAQMMTMAFALFMLLAYSLFIHSSNNLLKNERKSV